STSRPTGRPPSSEPDPLFTGSLGVSYGPRLTEGPMATTEDDLAKKQVQEAVWTWAGRAIVVAVVFGFGFFAAWLMWGVGERGAPPKRRARAAPAGPPKAAPPPAPGRFRSRRRCGVRRLAAALVPGGFRRSLGCARPALGRVDERRPACRRVLLPRRGR